MTANPPPVQNPSRHNAQHYPGLDTLRALAILMVIPRHAAAFLGGAFLGNFWKQVFMHGWVGVDLFFVLSGFLIGSQVLQSVARDGRVNFGRFYLKRSLRIMPSYFFVLLVYLLWPDFREKPELDPAWRFLFYVMNYGRKGDAFSHAWSLCVEEHFYIVFPLLLAACAWRPKLFRPSALIAFIMIAEPLLRFYLWTKDAPFFVDVYRPSHTHLDGLAIGVALAALRESHNTTWNKLIKYPWLLCLIGVILVGSAMWLFLDLKGPVSYIFTFSLISFGFGALAAAAVTPNFWLSRVKIPGAATVATLAFSLYLTHKQMIHLATLAVGTDNPTLTLSVAVIFIAAASLVLYYAIERPGLRLRDKLLQRSPTPTPESQR